MTAAEAYVPNLTPLNPNGIPDELKLLEQWVGWRFEAKPDGGATKIPINVRTGARASSTNHATWTSFSRALASYNRGQVDGIGFVFTREDPYIGFDRDDVEEGDPFGLDALVDEMGTHTEVSPSGNGIHIIGEGKLPSSTGKHPKGLGIFEHSRFFTMTGNLVDGEVRPIRDIQDVIDRKWSTWFPPPPESAPPPSSSTGLNDEKILELVRSARNGAKFDRLWSGDLSDHNDNASEADLALLSHLTFYTQDAGQLDRLYRQSALYREKWERQDYRTLTISKALERTEYYSPRGTFRLVNGGKSTPPPEEDPPGEPQSQRSVIDAGNNDLEVVSAQAWSALKRSNNPPRLFRFGGVPVRIEGDDDDAVPVAQTLTEDRLGHELARCAEWFKITQKGDDRSQRR